MAHREIRTKIVGVSHGDRQKLIKKHARPGLPVELVPEPKNPVNPRAVAVYVKQVRRFRRDKQHHLGYLTDERAELIQDYWQKKRNVTAIITDVTGGTKGKETRGVNILVTIE
jgi:hypothetical protein